VVEEDNLNRSLARQRRNNKRKGHQGQDESEFLTLLTGTLKNPTESETIRAEQETESELQPKEKPEKPGVLAGDQTMSR